MVENTSAKIPWPSWGHKQHPLMVENAKQRSRKEKQLQFMVENNQSGMDGSLLGWMLFN